VKLAELVSVFFKEDKHKIYTFLGNKVRISLWTYQCTGHVLFSMYANLSLSTFCWVVRKWGTEHGNFVERNIWQTRQHFLKAHINALFCYKIFYTCRHLHQRIEEHKGSAIGNHLREEHDMELEDIAQSFWILRKCQTKFDCLIFEMFFIKELKPTLNKQCDSIPAKLFVKRNSCWKFFHAQNSAEL